MLCFNGGGSEQRSLCNVVGINVRLSKHQVCKSFAVEVARLANGGEEEGRKSSLDSSSLMLKIRREANAQQGGERDGSLIGFFGWTRRHVGVTLIR